MNLKEIFKKQGGMKLIRQYWKGGALFTAFGEFFLLGKSRTALEILRLSASFKTKEKLKYAKALRKFNEEYLENVEHKDSNKVWICWLQGIENAPNLVKYCYKSIKENLADRDIVLITSQNMQKYVQFPDFIMEKWKLGQITNTHITDLLRLELLIRYGGMWVDATVLCTSRSEDIPKYYLDSELSRD